jgi:hypothetical protein
MAPVKVVWSKDGGIGGATFTATRVSLKKSHSSTDFGPERKAWGRQQKFLDSSLERLIYSLPTPHEIAVCKPIFTLADRS